jgi:hypothetical protein
MPSADPQRVPEKSPFYTKTTFNNLSELIVSETIRAQENGRYGPEAIEKITDALFFGPRLTQWHMMDIPTDSGKPVGYQLWTKDDLMYVTVLPEIVTVTKGIRNFTVIKGLQAETLYKAIATAQEILRPVQPIAEADAEEFFGGPSDTNGADLDAALADSPAGDVKPEGYMVSDDPDDAEELTGIMGDVVEAVEAESHTLDANLSAAVETAEAAEEYGNECPDPEPQPTQRNTVAVEDRKGFRPKSAAFVSSWKSIHEGHVSDEWVLARYKSLQGRMLNIVEAAIGDKEQRAAIKTLVNKEFRREMSNVKGSVPLAEE